jgi:hypothetical protein
VWARPGLGTTTMARSSCFRREPVLLPANRPAMSPAVRPRLVHAKAAPPAGASVHMYDRGLAAASNLSQGFMSSRSRVCC